MTLARLTVFSGALVLCLPVLGQTALHEGEAAYSSSRTDADAADLSEGAGAGGAAAGGGDVLRRTGTRPFSAFAVAVKVGTGGVGFDLATPLATKFNVRAGGSFFSYSPNLTEDGINVTGTANFRTVDAHLDWFPFGNGFRISPGVTLYNGNKLNGVATIPGNQTFSLGDGDYYSSPSDPVHGTFDVAFGNKVAPSLTVGFGNMIPRSGRHFSVPFEIGFEYIGPPTVALTLAGTACAQGQPAAVGCQPVATNPQTQANVKQEQADLNSDLSPARFYPIASVGVSYRF